LGADPDSREPDVGARKSQILRGISGRQEDSDEKHEISNVEEEINLNVGGQVAPSLESEIQNNMVALNNGNSESVAPSPRHSFISRVTRRYGN
jgi:hypothetical protein